MRISGTNAQSPQLGQMGMGQQADSVTKDIQRQIANKQKELQELSSNGELGAEEKQKKRQELMKEISELNNQLRQRQIDQRREAANAKKNQGQGSSVDDLLGGKRKGKSGKGSAGLSKSSMKALISADASLSLAEKQGSVTADLEGRARVLESEIKQDAGRTDVTKKQEELAGLKQRIESSESSQMDTLSKANEEMAKADEAEQPAEKGEKEEKVKGGKGQKGQKAGEGKPANAAQADHLKPGAETEKEGEDTQKGKNYPSIDIRL